MTHRLALAAIAGCLALTACGARPEEAPPGPTAGSDAGAPDAVAPGPSVDAAPVVSAAPRLVAPLSTSRVTSRRPTLRWELPSGATEVTVDLCFDRACDRPLGTPALVKGSTYAPDTDLPRGVVFWRVRASTSVSPTWQFTVGAGSAPVDSSWGTTLDVNGDGYADVAVGQPGEAGAALVYLGGAEGLADAPATTIFGAAVAAPSAGFGTGVASAGDVNGDGFADLLVTTSADSLVAVYVFGGAAAGLGTTPLSVVFPPSSEVLRFSAASAGDVNGDGYADLVVGAEGTAYVYLGGPTGLAPTPATTLALASDDGGLPGDLVSTVTSAGDVNGDGYGDIVASFTSLVRTGANTVYLGSKSGISTLPATTLAGAVIPSSGGGAYFNTSIVGAGDVNGDGYADILSGSCSAPDCAWVYLGGARGTDPKPATTLTLAAGGIEWVASAGDVNGDGFGDVAVAEQLAQGSVVAVYLGSAYGLVTSPVATPTEPEAAVDNFAQAVASAGDVNGDGFADLVVGAADGVPGNAPDPTGSAYVFLGSANGVAMKAATTLVGIRGEQGLFGSAVFGATN